MIFHQLTLINIYGKCLRKGGNPNAMASAVFSQNHYITDLEWRGQLTQNICHDERQEKKTI